MPFGGASRICVGQNVARMTMLHTVAALFRACPSVELAATTTPQSMVSPWNGDELPDRLAKLTALQEFVDYFAIKPVGLKCEIVSA